MYHITVARKHVDALCLYELIMMDVRSVIFLFYNIDGSSTGYGNGYEKATRGPIT